MLCGSVHWPKFFISAELSLDARRLDMPAIFAIFTARHPHMPTTFARTPSWQPTVFKHPLSSHNHHLRTPAILTRSTYWTPAPQKLLPPR